jgi:PilZ domain
METTSEIKIPRKQATARAALINLGTSAASLLTECFREYNIEVVPLEGAVERRLGRERFDALVLRLQPETEPLITDLRNGGANQRTVVFGIANDAREAMRYSHFGINALFEERWLQEPMNRDAVSKVVCATHLLVARELRRYVRVPIVTEVAAQAGAQRFTAYTQEVSAGGLSMTGAPRLPVGHVVHLSFTLPSGEKVNVAASVCWLREADSSMGTRFDPADERRNIVRDWIEQYLEFS